MAFNLPQYDVTKFSFGPAVIYIGPVGTTPTTDIGAVRSGMTLELGRTLVDINQGNPATLAHTFVTAESATLTVTGLELDFVKIAKVLGVPEPSDPTEFGFGGFLYVTPVAIKIVHEMPVDNNLEIYIWKARGGAGFTMTFGDDPHEYSYTFNAIASVTDWAGNVLPADQQLLKMKLVPRT